MDEMKEIIVKGKKIYIVESHHQVLEAWESEPMMNVFSLDYHTDTREAFQYYSYWRADSEIKSGICSDSETRIKELTEQKISQYRNRQISIKDINCNLRHDEHLDFSVRTNLIDTVFVFSKNRNITSSNPNVHILDGQKEYSGQRIIEYSPPCVPECGKDFHDEECRTVRADYSISDSVLDEAVKRVESIRSSFLNNYILDIDCDFFNTEKSLHPGRYETFKELVRRSRFLTIALESECVRICRHKGSHLNSEEILTGLLSIVEEI